MNIRKYILPIESYTRKNAPSILTAFGMMGVVGTAVMAVKDSKKADKLICKREEFKIDKYGEKLTKTEKVIAATPAYLPTIMTGLTTITCIYGSNHINKNRQALLMSAYGYLNNCFMEYKDAVNELYGTGADKEIQDHIIQNNAPTLEDDPRNDVILVYEEYGDTYISTTKMELDAALYHANRHLYMFGTLSINNFLELLGEQHIEYGDAYGWSYYKNEECDAMAWLDLVLEKVKTPEDHPLYYIKWNVAPTVDYVEWHLY